MFERLRQQFAKQPEEKAPLYERIAEKEKAVYSALEGIEGDDEHKLNTVWEQTEDSRARAEQHIRRLALTETVIGAAVTTGAALLKQPELAITAGVITGMLDLKEVFAHFRAEHGIERARMRIKNARERLAQHHV